jgi:hypothetical protein
MDHEEITLPDKLLPQHILIDVSPYDSSHEQQLQKLPCWPAIQRILTGPQRISRSQFLAYSLFRFRDVLSVDDLQGLLQSKELLFHTTLQSSVNSVFARSGADPTRRRPELQEIGEAVGLCVADLILGTTEMDWEPIAESNLSKTLDYYAASDAEHRVELECKGTLVENRKLKCSAVSNLKKSIEGKKAASPDSTALRLGTITALDKDSTGRPHTWILDPPASSSNRPPREARLLSRMLFLSRWISFVSPTSPVAAALSTRVADLESLSTLSMLDGIPLRDGRGKPFELSPLDPRQVHSRFFSTRSIVADGPVGGVVVPMRAANRLFFLGIRQDLVEMATTQKQQAILGYQNTSAIIEKRVIGVFSRGRFQSYGFNTESSSVRPRGHGYFEVHLSGPLHYTAGGLVFGWLAWPDDL